MPTPGTLHRVAERLSKSTFRDVDLSESEFADVSLERARFENVAFTGATLRNVSLRALASDGGGRQACRDPGRRAQTPARGVCRIPLEEAAATTRFRVKAADVGYCVPGVAVVSDHSQSSSSTTESYR
jgi:pentapeptide repeat protein